MRRALLLVLVGLGCRLTGTIGRDDPNGGGSGGGTMGASESTAAAATEGEVGGTAEGEGEGSGVGSESASSTSTSGSSSDTTSTVPHACVPTPDDSECSECRKVSCCEPLEVCLGHEICTCWWDCMELHTVEQCAMTCGADHSFYDDLQTCTHGHCDACP